MKRKGGLEHFEKRLVDGMRDRGYAEQFARQIYKQILGFGEYGFPESHSASFALLVYVSCWLKCYEPAAFTCALLNSQPMGFYSPSQLTQDLRRHGGVILPADVCISEVECTLEYTESEPGHIPSFPRKQYIRHSRESGNPASLVRTPLDPRFRGDDDSLTQAIAYPSFPRKREENEPPHISSFPRKREENEPPHISSFRRKTEENEPTHISSFPRKRESSVVDTSATEITLAHTEHKSAHATEPTSSSPALRLGLCMVKGLP